MVHPISTLSPKSLKHVLFASLACLAAAAPNALAAPPAGYKLVWSDEFNQTPGAVPDPSVWKYDLGGGGFGNGELETYVNDPAHVHIVKDPKAIDGKALEILSTNTDGYKSVRMLSAGKKSFQYGFIESRIKLPYGQGIWPAFWMLGDSIGKVGWPSSGEIDIMENIGKASWGGHNLSSLHSGIPDSPGANFTKNAPYDLPAGQTFHDSYHLFQMLWLKDQISFYIDGHLYETRTPADYGKNPWPFNAPFFFIINTAVGGTWPGSPDSTTVFPQHMLVDYVRVYQGSAAKAPTPVSHVAAKPGTGKQIQVSWNSDINASMFRVYRSENPTGSGGMVVADNVQGTQFTDSKTVPGHKYTYWISSSNAAGESKASSLVSAIAPVPVEAPFGGVTQAVPGVVEAEDFDTGGEGLAYHDPSSDNNGGTHRPNESVHVEDTNDVGGGFDLGYSGAGQWLKYTVDVQSAGTYDVVFRVSSGMKGGTFHLENADGVNLTGPVQMGSTGGWQNWEDIHASVTLPAGKQTLKWVEDTGGYNLNRITFSKAQ